ncbi:non-ribosomal peptide synthetase [Myxacorys almedinensis]|uniref:Amino acid adenylation domain-containing protein n=1 Tax=Myxacorys almedinensis A TaxID=2690445 RepID=A0A8J8CJE2_9CYAN|nr:non-ribosomal peptide synthetase [Myxacorys almedinensis]NDJ18574.1 amino acid adenylation domain-containing protein [Myxacorys almedinensis A]
MQLPTIEGYRLSPQQKHLWSLQQSHPDVPTIAQGVLLCQGALQVETLKTAIEKVIQRHEILRTTFQCLPEMILPLQVIQEKTNLSISVAEPLSDYDLSQLELWIQSYLQENSQASFEQSASLRVAIVPLAPQQHLLILSLPSLCADATTLQFLASEISRTYAGNFDHEPDEPMQYADLAEWQNDLLEAEATNCGKTYWQQQFMDLSGWKLPFERQGLQAAPFQPRCFTAHLDAETISQLAQNYNGSIAAVLLTCWQVLLWRMTSRSDITIGVTNAGRKYEDLQYALGLLDKCLPLQSHLEENDLLSQRVQQTAQIMQEAHQWQEYFTGLPLVTLPVGFEFAEWSVASMPDLTFSIYQQAVYLNRFKIKLSCIRQSGQLRAEFHYDANLFAADAIAQIANYFQTLLTSIINQPDAKIADLNFLGDRDRQRLLVDFNQTTISHCNHSTIHQWFEQQVEQSPDRVAVVFEDQSLTYAELNARANQLAHFLRTQGIEPEQVVALYVDRSPEMLIGLLGILKAGGAYLPLDPGLPTTAVDQRLQQVQATILLTQQQLAKDLTLTAQVICLDTDWSTIAQQATTNLTNWTTPENLVYVLFTSGSTGKPKGVAVEHRQLLNYVNGILTSLTIPEGASFATVSTLAADLGNTTLFACLCTGGCLHLISQERSLDPNALAEYGRRHAIDYLKIVPSHLKVLLDAADCRAILPRRQLILGGETLHWHLVEQIRQHAPTCQILNHYGPTETTVGVLTYEVQERLSAADSETVPLGYPLPNTQVYLLDTDLQPVPLGFPGEIYIGGASVTRGYHAQPELTAAAFVPHPFSSNPDARLYKTGDHARYRLDGTIEFLGRADQQVKIRGFRIELGEIEAALKQHPEVREAIVLATEAEHPQLLAYVVPEQAADAIDNLRQFLQAKLPEVMVPFAIIPLKTLPLLPNGKLDRRTLLTMELPQSDTDGAFVPPRTSVEATIAQIWETVLRLPQVGIYDNFFELGGDSILCIQVIAKASQAGLRFTPKQLFEHPTIVSLAAVVNTAPVVAAEQGIVTGIVPLTPIQHWFFEQDLPEPHHWNQSILLQVQQPLNPVLLRQALSHLLQHHDALRLRFHRDTTGWQQINTDVDAIVPFTQLDLSTLATPEQSETITAVATDLQTSLNLADGPLMRVVLFNLGNHQPDRLLLILHHLVVDGVSWRILLEDLQTAYQQLAQSQAVQLPAKTTSFKEWSARLQNYADSEALQQELTYWQQESGAATLPMDNLTGANTVALTQTVSVALTQTETDALLQEVPATYQTQINDVLLTALVQAFFQWTQIPSLYLDLEGHGRESLFEDVEVSRTIGWFTTIFPVQLQLDDPQHSEKCLKSIKEQLRQIPRQGIGYGILRYLNQDEATAGLRDRSPACVKFNYLGQVDAIAAATSLFAPALESTGLGRSPQGNRRYLLDITAIVSEGQLHLRWDYSAGIYQRPRIEQLAQHYLTALRSLIVHCQSSEVGGYTPSDFPDAQLDQEDLDLLIAQLS